MLEIQYANVNHNIKFVKELFLTINPLVKKSYWAVGDLDLVPKFHGDYPPVGKSDNQELSYNYCLRVRNERVIFSTLEELQEVFLDTETITWGVFLCFSNDVVKDKEFRLCVEVKEIDKMQHPLAIVEIRILDGDLFTLLSKDKDLLKKVKETFPKDEMEMSEVSWGEVL